VTAHIEYRCDICAATGAGRWQRYGLGPAAPEGWHYFGGKHCCSYACLEIHVHELGSEERTARIFARADKQAAETESVK
jgi:hypothetical protein